MWLVQWVMYCFYMRSLVRWLVQNVLVRFVGVAIQDFVQLFCDSELRSFVACTLDELFNNLALRLREKLVLPVSNRHSAAQQLHVVQLRFCKEESAT